MVGGWVGLEDGGMGLMDDDDICLEKYVRTGTRKGRVGGKNEEIEE